MTKGQPPVQVERYEQFFGLHEAPFGLAPNPRYLFESASHGSALAQLTYAIERREPLVVMTGEIGTGKTLLCRTMLDRQQPAARTRRSPEPAAAGLRHHLEGPHRGGHPEPP